MEYQKQNFLEALRGHKPDHIPFWFMRQAGRYLPEYRALRADAGGFLNMAYNPELASEVTMQPIRRFQMDAAIIFSDILVIPHALGQHLEFVQGEGPKLDALRSSSEFSKLNFSRFESTLAPVYEALSKTKTALQTEGFNATSLIGFCGAPWTVACYMVEGGGSKDFMNVKKLAYADPEGFQGLIDLLVESSAQYLINQINAGADAVQIFDSWAGALDAQSFQRWVVKPTRQIVDLIRDTHPSVPIIGFPRCAGHNYLSYVQDTGVTAVGIDPSVDTKWAARTLQPLAPVQGNLDPIALLAGGDNMILAAEKIIGDLVANHDGKNFVFNLGHGINKETPVEHVEQLVKFIREYKI